MTTSTSGAIHAQGDFIRTEIRPICRFDRVRRTRRRAGARYQRQAGNNDGCKVTRRKRAGGARDDGRVRHRPRGRTQAVRDHAHARRAVAGTTARARLGDRGREDGRRRAEHDLRRERGRGARRFHRLHVARLSRAEDVSEPAGDRLDFHRAGRHHDRPRRARTDPQLLFRLRDAAAAVRMDFARARPCARDGRARSRRRRRLRGVDRRTRDDRQLRSDAAAVQHDPQGREDRRERVHLGRVGHRQGADGARDSRALRARQGAVRRDQLRRDSASPAAVGAVRL